MNSKTFIILTIFIIVFLVLIILYNGKYKNTIKISNMNSKDRFIDYTTLSEDDITYLTDNTFIPELNTVNQNLNNIQTAFGTDYNNPTIINVLQSYVDDNLITQTIYDTTLNDNLQYNLDNQKKLLTYKLFNRAI